MADQRPLSDEERAELEELRAEKARREAEEQARRDRLELEKLRREQKVAERSDEEAQALLRQQEQLEKNRKFMEGDDDDDLTMAPGQKIVIIAVIGIALLWLLATVLG